MATQVQCAGCRRILNVPAGLYEFACPKCSLLQALPPQLRQGPAAGGVSGAKIQLPCANCRAILNVPHGLHRFRCPQCHVELAVDPDKLAAYLSSMMGSNRSGPSADINGRLTDGSTHSYAGHNSNTHAAHSHSHVPAHSHSQTHGIPTNSHGHGIGSGTTIEALSKRGRDLISGDAAIAGGQTVGLLPPPAKRSQPEPQEEEINEVALEVEQEEDEDGPSGETFTDYRPSKLAYGSPHPDPVVETASLAAVEPPDPTYDLVMRDDPETMRALSCLQLETVVYACQRHNFVLKDGTRAGFFIGDGAGVGKGRTVAGVIKENWKHGRRKALWLSVASDLKYDAIRDLEDVGLTEAEVHPLNKLPYGKLDSTKVGVKEGVIFLTYSSLIAASEKGHTRLRQLVNWCGPDFDGLIVFDECHKAKNLVPETGSSGTKTGEAVLELQAKLPNARVVYCSATGASEPRNLGYMVRLGLWGPGTDLPDFSAFLGALEKRGVGALELVAMDMKARGVYLCRTLSFSGAEFDIVEVALEPKMQEMYTKAAQFWAELRVDMMGAVDSTAEGVKKSNMLWRFYWATHQRFFRHMCMSAKVPAVVRMSHEALCEGKCVVIGLQSTGEARTEEAVSKYGMELDDFVSGPRELLIKLVEDHYPVPPEPKHLEDEDAKKEMKKKPERTTVSTRGRIRKTVRYKGFSDDDEEDEEEPEESESDESDASDFKVCSICATEYDDHSLLECACCRKCFHLECLAPPLASHPEGDWLCPDCDSNTAEIKAERKAYIAELWRRYAAAMQRKAEILDCIKKLDLPNNPLDDIIDQLGGPDNVAEMTGRKGMLLRSANGKGVIYQSRNTKEVSMEMINIHEKQQFMEGHKLVAVISEAASAGISLQADRRAPNKRRRVHITLELPWSADRAIQQFGRTHRSNQANAPQFRLLFTTLGGERRFASVVAKRLECLGALTQGDRRAGGPSLREYNYDSIYGKRALGLLYKAVLEQQTLSVLPPDVPEGEAGKEASQLYFATIRAALISCGIIKDATASASDVQGITNGGLGMLGRPSGKISDADMHDVGRFLNRVLGLEQRIQNMLFDYFVLIFEDLVRTARKEGQFDSGIIDVRANHIEIASGPKVERRVMLVVPKQRLVITIGVRSSGEIISVVGVNYLRNQLAGEANINMHNFPSFSKKALDLEAKIGHGQTPTTDGRRKSLPPNWKAKGPIMFVDNDGSTIALDDNDGSTIELDDNFQEGVGSEAGSVEASGGGVVVVVAQKGKATGGRRGGSRSRSQVDPNAPPWEKAGLGEDVWRDRYTRQACIRCGQYGHNQFKCCNKKVTEKIPPTMGQALGSSTPVGSNVASTSGTAPGNTTVEEHVAYLDKVLSLLRQHKFKINGEKCEFGPTRTLYLGHEISADDMKPDDAKVASIRGWPRPQSVTEMRSFLGMTGYYHNFVKNYSIVAAPLTDLTRLDIPWEWTDRCEAAIRQLKHALTHHEVLKLPDRDKSFVVTTNASQYGIGAVLAQQEGKKFRPVEYMSKKMPSQKLTKSTYEKELYAIYKALTHWRHYLLGRFFYVRADHQTLKWMRTQPVLSDALNHWMIEVIEQYDFEPQYIKGECNKVADALSRRPDFSGALITEFGLADDVTQSMVEAYREDQFMSEIIRRLEAKDKITSAESELVNGLLFLENEGNKRLCVPNRESLRSLFLGECHDATGHFGFKKTAANLLQQFWWPTMLRDAKLYVETCQVCQRDKPRTQAPLGLLKPLPIPERPGESLSMDFMDTLVTSKSGMRHIFVIVDRFSKYARLVAMPETAKIEYVIRLFKENWVRDFGLPKSIVSDRDVRFTSELWKAAAAEQGTQLQITSGNHPEANGQAEQLNRAVQHLLRHYIKPNQVNWDEKLALIASLYNNAVHSATGVSPNSLLLTFKPRLPVDFLLPDNQSAAPPGTLDFAYRYEQRMQQAVEQMHKAQAAMIETENKHRRPSSFQVGDRVYVKSSELGQEQGISRKLMPQYIGPWEVLDVVGEDLDGPSYVIRIPGHLRTYPVFHASKLAPFRETDQFPSRRSMLPPTMDGEVDINDIVDHREMPTVCIDPMSGAATLHYVVKLDRGLAWERANEILETAAKEDGSVKDNGFYKSVREWLGRSHYLLAVANSISGSGTRMFKIYRPPSGAAPREMPEAEFKSKYKKLSSKDTAADGWKREYQILANQCMHGPKCKIGPICTVGRRVQEMHLLGGLILPVWGTVESVLARQERITHRRLRVVQLETTDDGRRLVGIHVPNSAIHAILSQLESEHRSSTNRLV
ncbi:hypothetical protein CBR_g11926 [Chara braunii]|uniref:PHD-type domain-containing protein n=1 Tax=Chara braunii TaxID=69332 RepID=A0A388KQM7_CHABU|nr:hypothetical protein CBR_g11926 [Chara braunii]|eukprot:GBG72349.1 hypothetical protein CBR_g11926 [Chara braunii]